MGDQDWLLELRQVDDRLRDMSARLEGRRADLQRSEKEMHAVEEALAQERARLESAKARHREGDREIETCRSNRQRFETQLLSVKTNVEYQALLREIAVMQEKAREWEEVVLTTMEQEEAAQATIAKVAANVREKQAAAEEERALFENQRKQLEEEQTQLSVEREKLIGSLTPFARNKYDRLTATKGDAIVPIVQGSCGGCHYNLPPQTVNEVRRNARLILCEGCGRILVWLK